VEISAIRDAAGGVTIAISDNGVGIAEKDLDRVMQPFERGVQPGGRSVPGTGLGLPLAQQILELHGGTLRLRSAPGVGTTATVTLPATRLRPSQGGS
jgi:signal transduction histidine kinase